MRKPLHPRDDPMDGYWCAKLGIPSYVEQMVHRPVEKNVMGDRQGPSMWCPRKDPHPDDVVTGVYRNAFVKRIVVFRIRDRVRYKNAGGKTNTISIGEWTAWASESSSHPEYRPERDGPFIGGPSTPVPTPARRDRGAVLREKN